MHVTRFVRASFLFAMLVACGSATDALTPDARASTDGAAETATLATLGVRAVDPDPQVATEAIDALRAAGPDGLAALLTAQAVDVALLREAPLDASPDRIDGLRSDPALQRLRDAIDRVAAQRDAFASGLYWYTDLSAAQAEATRTGRPILSLRLLGRLDEEASCANSRFFRWLLYPNPTVREALRGYVLHWSSERPAPHITIDMGDGRTIERTITGNSIHYVLDASGRVIDAIAGLHDAQDFAARITQAQGVATRCGVRYADRACLAREHTTMLDGTRVEWALLGDAVPSWDALVAADAPVIDAPSAALAMPLTMGKSIIEMPMLRMIEPTPVVTAASPIDWSAVVSRVRWRDCDTLLGEPSRSLAHLKTGRVDDEALGAATCERLVGDTVRNRFTLDRRLHAWLADATVANDFTTLNARVYAELFLTPASDPWLGLRGESDWDVLEVEGRVGGRN
jgi:hypothetical protein